jgi:two-component system OmpR family sensor kinase
VGRLFWKFFIFIWLGQLTTILGVSSVWILHHNENQRRGGIDTFPSAAIVESAAATLQFGGQDALRNLLKAKENFPVYAVNEAGQDILGRPILADAVAKARARLINDVAIASVKKIDISGENWLIFSEEGSLLPKNPPRRLFPWVPIIAATIASLIFASLLAWYFSKPIRNLRSAFESVSSGNLEVDLNSIMGGRRDDLADLGRDFDRMTNQLRTLIEGQRRLLHDISHELRSPLARLQVAIGLARQQPDKAESSMVRIERESVRMDHLVGELLTLSKVEAGLADSMKEHIDPEELLADIVDDAQFEAKAQGKDVQLVGRVNTSIQGNAELIHRAIENVIRNAIKHSPSGSNVIVNIGESTSQLQITILDSGAGVVDAELEQIFEPFFRSNTNGNSADGHGLGLAIARRVIDAHGGIIRASNRAAGGLCVEILLLSTTSPNTTS